MIVRRYFGQTEEEALQKARQELGPDCVVFLSKKRPEKGGIELIVAAEGEPDLFEEGRRSKPAASAEPTEIAAETSPKASRRKLQKTDAPINRKPSLSSSSSSTTGRWIETIRREIARSAYSAEAPTLSAPRSTPSQWLERRLEEVLEAQEVAPEVRAQILENLRRLAPKGQGSATALLARALHGVVPVGRPEVQSAPVWVFVGPSGVGKTTTLAKLAARLSGTLSRRVGLLSLDVYRAGAQEQLAAYARILNLPFRVAYSPAEVQKAVEELSNCDHLLVDTPGCNPRDAEAILRLRQELRPLPRRETFLILSATTRLGDLWSAATGFYDFPVTQLILTKVDETALLGTAVTFVAQSRLPIAYCATGPELPDDLETVSLQYLAHLLLRAPDVRYA
ncbi:MAG: flagellar biosynthesis protein FlhF [Candidatus Poribacteria bacterium]|nr:MAG: flagellar biosynthesis protein FlhF [Candidatus Poribacteria bacterium]